MTKRNYWGCILTTLFVMGSSTIAPGAEITRSGEKWADQAMESMLSKGLLTSIPGQISPNDIMTRGQMASILVQAFGATVSGTGVSGYTDVPVDAWYRNDLEKAVHMGILTGDNHLLRPEDPITREEAFTLLARAFQLENSNQYALLSFADRYQVSSWAVSGVSALAERGYIKGDEKMLLHPQNHISIGEFSSVLDRIAGNMVRSKGSYSQFIKGNVLVSAAGAVLKDVTIEGNLYLADGIGDGEIILDTVTVQGDIFVRGGKLIELDSSSIKKIVVNNQNNPVTLSINGTSPESIVTSSSVTVQGDTASIDAQGGSLTVEGNSASLLVSQPATVHLSDGTFEQVTLDKNASGSQLTTGEKASLTGVYIDSPKTKVAVSGETKLISLGDTSDETSITVNKTANVNKISVSSDNITIEGEGTLKSVDALDGVNTVTVNTKGTDVTAGYKARNVTARSETVSPGKTVHSSTKTYTVDKNGFIKYE